ncbi:hypothetical protein HGA64_03270 [Candidatus Falkowbacteria bacterium]|nr:hypothetical protein [Candidatus Falkowbacteria bacterium]
MRIFLGLLVAVIGIAMVIKTEFLVNNFGRIPFFDKYLGSEGGTRLGYKLIGILVGFIGILLATNLFNNFMEWVLSPLTSVSKPAQEQVQDSSTE